MEDRSVGVDAGPLPDRLGLSSARDRLPVRRLFQTPAWKVWEIPFLARAAEQLDESLTRLAPARGPHAVIR
jgi:hypothetical protein